MARLNQILKLSDVAVRIIVSGQVESDLSYFLLSLIGGKRKGLVRVAPHWICTKCNAAE